MMRKAVIVDFDGTLVSVNSFEEFFKRLFKFWMGNFQIVPSFYLIVLILIRKLKLIKHADLKKRILCYVQKKDIRSFLDGFSELLLSNVNKKVLEVLEDYRNKDYSILLCTAAPKIYIEVFAKLFAFKFDGIACTENPTKGMKWEENIGRYKLKTAMELLRERNEELSILLTDHHDDLPLLEVGKTRNIVVAPSERTISILKSKFISFMELR